MYNGIGLLTPRGSGTSGYVQANKFNLRGRPPARGVDDPGQLQGPEHREPNRAILDHNRKRDLELKLAQLAESLEEQGYAPAEVEREVAEMRRQMEAEGAAAPQLADDKPLTETHQLAERKQEEMEELRKAWGIEAGSEGQAFNRELQEQKKQERIAEREAKEKEKAKREKEAAKAREKAAKQRVKEAKERAKAAEEQAKQAKQEALERPVATQYRPSRQSAFERLNARDNRDVEGAWAYERRPSEWGQSGEGRGRHELRGPARGDMSVRPPRYPPQREAIPSERWEPRGPTPPPEVAHRPRTMRSHVLLVQPPEPAPSASPTPPPHRSRTPSPSPAKVLQSAKQPPPPRSTSPPRGAPRGSPPPRKRARQDSSVSASPEPGLPAHALQHARYEVRDRRGHEPARVRHADAVGGSGSGSGQRKRKHDHEHGSGQVRGQDHRYDRDRERGRDWKHEPASDGRRSYDGREVTGTRHRDGEAEQQPLPQQNALPPSRSHRDNFSKKPAVAERASNGLAKHKNDTRPAENVSKRGPRRPPSSSSGGSSSSSSSSSSHSSGSSSSSGSSDSSSSSRTG